MEELFSVVLDDDEKIIKTFKPSKSKMWFSVLLKVVLFFIWFVGLACVTIFLPDENGYVVDRIYLLIPLCVFVFIIIVSCILIAVYYHNLCYAYTNKRLIVRSGIFGVDYKSLDMGMIGAVNVNVSLLDKMLRKNTGTITFGSMASPIGMNQYRFAHVLSPYDTCKEIKSTIDAFKNKRINKSDNIQDNEKEM